MEEGKEKQEQEVEETEVQIFPAEASSKINESLSFDKAYDMTSLGKISTSQLCGSICTLGSLFTS